MVFALWKVLLTFFFSIFIETAAPIWLTSQFVQAASYKVINGDVKASSTGSSQTPTATMPFVSSFPGVPNLGYGFTNYQAEDFMFNQKFEINRTALTSSSFSVLVQISETTNIWTLEVRYIAISPSFPHHLNSFDNVPINYGRTLVNLTTMSISTQTFTNTINYTTQATAAGSNYKYFSSPLTNNKILLLMTSFFIDGTSQLLTSHPLNLVLTATPMSTQTYKLSAAWGESAAISRLHFSMIIFDKADVEASGKYHLIYEKINFPVSGGRYPFPVQFLTNFMIGFVEFSSDKTGRQIHFILNFQTVSGSYGVTMLQAIPRIHNKPLSRFCFTIFYIKTWICPTQTYFDSTSNTCITCSVANCNVCLNTSYCVECSTNYAVNSSTGQCYQQPCTLEGCTSCINMTACLTCNATLNYVLVANLTCVYCPLNLNYFPNETLQSCQQCTLSNCLNCSSLTTCSQCNTAASYYIGTNNTCQYCNNSQNFFINSSLQCQSCLVTNCLVCQTLTTCLTCNPGYLINTTNSQCASCSLSNCASCSNLTACQICSTGYVLNSATKQCQVCTLTGCLNCSTTTTCVQCNTSANYILSFQTCQQCPGGLFANSTSNTCEVCTLSNCLMCTSLTSCGSCDTGSSYYLSSGTCSYCDPGLNMLINSKTLGCQMCTIPFCSNCSSLTVCQNCSSSFLINTTDNLCYPCTLLHCVTCFNLSVCEVCDVGFVLNPTTGLCQLCTLTGCINCSTTITCFECDATSNYILSSQTCQLCSAGLFANATSSSCQTCTIPHCLVCSSLITCSSCDTASSYYLSSLWSCSYCDPSLNMFINSTSQGCQTCTIAFCVSCLSLTSCLNCSSGFSFNPADGLCYSSTCNNTQGYFFNITSFTCQLCSISNCQNCSSLSTCSICSSGFFVNSVTGQCENQTIPNCGNGIFLLPQQCDDGNLLDGDGCSSTCTVKANYTCQPNPTPSMLNSVCFYIGEITLKVVYIEKVDNANKLEILLQIGPKDANFWKGVDFSNMVSLSNMTGFENYNVRMNADGTVSIIANYNTTIHNMNITVQLDPSLSGKDALSRYPPVSKQFEMVPSDNELAVYYDSSAYLIAKIAEALAYTVAASSLFFFLIGLFADKLVGVEMMAVIQISHLSLIGLSNLNPVFKALANILFVNGFNYFSMSKSYLLDQSTPLKAKGIYLYSYFVQNYNCTFLLILIPLLLSIIFLILSIKLFNFKKREKFLQFAKNCVCEYAFTGLMFGGYIISVSFALEVFYGLNNLGSPIPKYSIIAWALMIFIIVLYFILKIIKPQHFSEFTEKFNERSTKLYEQQNESNDLTDDKKQSCKTMISKFHYNFLIIERIIIGTCLIFMMNIKFSLLLPILVFLMFVFESIILKPYNELKHNIRFICNMIISIVILAIYLAYNLANEGSPLTQNKIWIFMPLLVCVLLLICVIYNAVFLVKSLIRKVSMSCKKEEPKNDDWLKEMTKQNLEIQPSRRKIFEQSRPEEQLARIEAQKIKISQIRKKVREQSKIDRKIEKKPVLEEADQYAQI